MEIIYYDREKHIAQVENAWKTKHAQAENAKQSHQKPEHQRAEMKNKEQPTPKMRQDRNKTNKERKQNGERSNIVVSDGQKI